MPDLFAKWADRVKSNSRRAVEAYARELPEYRDLATNTRTRDSLLEFAVVLRHRTVELAAADAPFTAEDNDYVAAAGQERAEAGVSPASQRRVLALYAEHTLREVQEVAEPDAVADLLRLLGWLGEQGAVSTEAFTRGYLRGQERVMSRTARTELLARLLLEQDPLAPPLARNLGIPSAGGYLVTAVRVAANGTPPPEQVRAEVVEAVVGVERVAVTWADAHQLMAFLPLTEPSPAAVAVAGSRAAAVARVVATATGRPCAVGTAPASARTLPAAATLAREISAQAPLEHAPRQARTLADVFVELGVEQAPPVDDWLRGLAVRLADGPDLVSTLDSYYRHDMNRLRTAAALNIHPRTVDYRLRRARELTGLEPSSARGVRVLSTAVTRILARTWPPTPPAEPGS